MENNIISEKTDNALTIQIRYCFSDEASLSMNAEIFNECERQFIKAIKSTEKYLEDTLFVEVKAREEGSLVDILTVALNNTAITQTILTLITVFATKFFGSKFLSSKQPKTEETSKKLDNHQKIKDAIKNDNLTEEEFDYIASHDKDLRKYKSIYFKNVKKEPKIEKVEVKAIPRSILNAIVIVVEKKDFDCFIIPDTTEKNEDIEQVKIHIVAPILIKGINDSWKGMLGNDAIDFKIIDKDFLEQVWSNVINFGNGTFINCDLKTIKTTNVETEETKISRKITNVINWGNDGKQIRKIIHRKPKKTNGNIQSPGPGLFDNI